MLMSEGLVDKGANLKPSYKGINSLLAMVSLKYVTEKLFTLKGPHKGYGRDNKMGEFRAHGLPRPFRNDPNQTLILSRWLSHLGKWAGEQIWKEREEENWLRRGLRPIVGEILTTGFQSPSPKPPHGTNRHGSGVQ